MKGEEGGDGLEEGGGGKGGWGQVDEQGFEQLEGGQGWGEGF